jgi:NTP pyrophosphatase (non-canonical NTP hydrolase)
MSSLMCPSWVSVPVENDKGDVIAYAPIRYDQFVLKLFKKMTDEKMLSHAGRGVADESGEINKVIKHHLDYEQELNMANLIEELGDMRFYLQAIQNLYGLTDEVILQANAVKLSVRYRNLEYSDEQARLRADKTDGKSN